MKKITALLILALPFIAMTQEKPFVIKGFIRDIDKPVGKVMLRYIYNDQEISDSAIVVNGAYSFNGKISEPLPVSISAKYAPLPNGTRVPVRAKDVANVFINPGHMEFSSSGSFANMTVKGSKADDEFKKLNAIRKTIYDKYSDLDIAYEKARNDKDSTVMQLIGTKRNALSNEYRNVYADYVRQDPTSPIAVYAISFFADGEMNISEVVPLFDLLPNALKQTKFGKNLAGRIAITRKTAIGQPALDFTQNDTSGIPVSLSSFKGKYVLIDFWASWCSPCRLENPNVSKAFNRFKDKGFTIVSVSLDQPGEKERWIAAIRKDQLPWTHVSDLKCWENAVAKQYNITAVPQNFLVDPAGKIVAKNLMGEDLQKKLTELIQ